MATDDKIFFSERGRKPLGSGSCYAYFEVLEPLLDINSVEIFALDDRGVVLGSGRAYKTGGFYQGFLFEVFFSSTPIELISSWQFQRDSWGQRVPRTFTVQMLQRDRWESEGAKVDYIRASASLVAVTNKLPRLKNGWTGPVVCSARSEVFHHPDCRRAKLIRVSCREEYDHAQIPWEQGLNPCQDCLFCLP
jgi:hypothetical protein